ncbi:MAG: hypothetical protein R3297_07085, partial [Desulfobulbales bacterium]|nr:hypothetical protein [Desulfobulbales bacterium]
PSGRAGEKAKLGPCVRRCIQAFNPSLADSGADEFMAADFRAKECVLQCKENIFQGECNLTADNCCHPEHLDTDPDCQVNPPEPPGGDNLPPDPGEAGKATLAGIDSDGDGIRDDIQRYIALNYPDSAKTRAALQQYTLALDKALMHSPDETSALNNTEIMHRASECLWYIHSVQAIKMSDLLIAEYLNTVDRSRAYLDYNDKLGGHVFGSKDFAEYRSSCTFDPDLMED